MIAADQITQLIQLAQTGDNEANADLIKLLYHDLKIIAARQRAKFNNLTLNTTGIVHEAWMKINNKQLNIKDRQHFMATAALAIRHLLINEVKKKCSQKRQASGQSTYLSDVHGQDDPMSWLLELDEMLNHLQQVHPRLAQVFQLRYFAGLTSDEIADMLQVTSKTVQRDWIKAKYLLASYLLK